MPDRQGTVFAPDGLDFGLHLRHAACTASLLLLLVLGVSCHAGALHIALGAINHLSHLSGDDAEGFDRGLEAAVAVGEHGGDGVVVLRVKSLQLLDPLRTCDGHGTANAVVRECVHLHGGN